MARSAGTKPQKQSSATLGFREGTTFDVCGQMLVVEGSSLAELQVA
jgi:hypothetical protein